MRFLYMFFFVCCVGSNINVLLMLLWLLCVL